MKGDSIVYILQLAAGREFDQVPFMWHQECEGFLLGKIITKKRRGYFL